MANFGKAEFQIFEKILKSSFSDIEAGQLHAIRCWQSSGSACRVESVGFIALYSALWYGSAALQRVKQRSGANFGKFEVQFFEKNRPPIFQNLGRSSAHRTFLPSHGH